MPDLVPEAHSRGSEFFGKFQNIGNGVEDGFFIPCIDENLQILLEAKLNSRNRLREKKGLETFDFGPMVDTDDTTVLGIGVFGDKAILAELADEIYKGRLQKPLNEQIRLNDKAKEEGLTAVEIRDKERALGG